MSPSGSPDYPTSLQKEIVSKRHADMGIRTPVAGVRGRHDWPLHYVSAKLRKIIRHVSIYICRNLTRTVDIY